MKDLKEQFLDAVKGRQLKAVFPEGTEPRILRAARILVDLEAIRPTLIGHAEDIQAVAGEMGLSLEGIDTTEAATDERRIDLAACYRARRPKASEKIAHRALERPLYYGSLLLATDHADLMVAGVGHATAKVIEAALMCVGLAPGLETASSFFLMSFPEGHSAGFETLVFADCAVVVEPSMSQLADIAVASAQSTKTLLGVEPRVAILSFSSHGSAQHPRVDFVKGAAKEVLRRVPHLKVEGDLQLDAALSESVATKKLKSPGPVAGQANVLVFPSLEAGNIGYKLTQYLGGAQALGPILQGFVKPVADLSRGASVDDIVSTTLATAAMVTEQTIATDGDV